MDVGGGQWLGPGQTARRLGVTTKALRVYEREGLVEPHRSPSGWRLYGPAQLVRLHQVIVLRDLGLPLTSIGKLLGSQSRLREVLEIQRERLETQRAKIEGALDLIHMAQRRLDAGGDLSLDDFATLTRETVVHPAMPMKAFQARLRALIAERDPSGEVVRALDVAAADLASGTSIETLRAEGRALLAKVGQLKEIGDFDSEEAKGLVRQWNARTSNVRRPSEAQRDLIRGAIHDAFAEAQAGPETLPYDLSALEFFREVARRMKARGELSGSG